MAKTLYLECSSGISGDMTVAALLDLGADRETLMEALESIPDRGFSVEIRRVKKMGIACCDFCVHLEEEYENYDHDMEYLYGHRHSHGGEGEHLHRHHGHPHGEEGGHGHEHSHGENEREGHRHGHIHRGIKEVGAIIEKVNMTESARELALKIFDIIAHGEAKAHDLPVEQVHFHEVGAMDSIVDVVAAAVCFDNLGVKEVIIPKLCEGQGTIRCQHGILPIPVPAVVNIVEEWNLPLEIMDVQGELVTPTGAAIAAAVGMTNRLPKCFRIIKTGIGAGKRQYERPGMLRAMLIEEMESEEKKEEETICCLETNIDDSTGEVLGYMMEKLLEAGAKDVHYCPVYMKKNRPAWQLTVLCGEEDISRLEDIIFSESTTIGIRRVKMKRTTLERRMLSAKTPWGDVPVKVCRWKDRVECYPEYEGVRKLCQKSGLPYREVYREVMASCKKEWRKQ